MTVWFRRIRIIGVLLLCLVLVVGLTHFLGAARVLGKKDIVIGTYGFLTTEYGSMSVRRSYLDDLGTLYERLVTAHHQPENVRGLAEVPNLYAVTARKPTIITVEVQGVNEKSVKQFLNQISTQVLGEQKKKSLSLRDFNTAQEKRLNAMLRTSLSSVTHPLSVNESMNRNEKGSRAWTYIGEDIAKILWLRTLLRCSTTSLYLRDTEVGATYEVNRVSTSIGMKLLLTFVIIIMGCVLVVGARIMTLGIFRGSGF